MEVAATLEQTIIDNLRAQTPLVGLPGVRLSEVKAAPAGPFDVSFQMESGPSRIQVLADIKPYFTPKALEAIAPWIARLKTVQPEAAFAIITPYLSQQAQEFCIEKGIDFIDLAGNVSINVPGRFVLRRLGMKRTQPLDPRMSPGILDVYSGRASRVLRVLLQKPGQWSLSEIAAELAKESRENPFSKNASATNPSFRFEISLGTISKALATLEQELWIRRRNSAILMPEPRRLLTRWAEKYKERYRWRLRSSFTSVNPFGSDLVVVNRELSSLGSNSYAFTGAAAAAIAAPFVDLEVIDIFVGSPESAQRFRQLKGRASSGPDIRFISPYDFGAFMYARRQSDIPIVSDVQAYLDLYARGGRDLKQADYLLENRILPAWGQK
jgi:hypothetical protein